MNRKIAFTLVALFCMALSAFAGLGGMYYKNYHVEAVVHANNVWDITETIEANFLEPRHGIYRYIPLSCFIDQKWKNPQGVVEQKRLQYDLDVDLVSLEGDDYKTDYDGHFAIYRLGNESRTLTGLHTYTIKYKVGYPYDRNTAADFLFHSVLGSDMEDEIKHFSFHVTFDKPFADYAKGKLKVYSGNYGEKKNALNAKVKQTANSISGEISNIPPKNAITLFLQLKDGYYESGEPHSPMPMKVCLGISLALMVFIVIKLAMTTRPIVTKPIEFYPPEGISSAEVGTIIDEMVDTVDIASLIPWFASQGYLTIKEIDEENGKKLGKHTKLELTRVKALPVDAPEYQKTFYDVLFSKGDVVRLDQLEEQPKEMEDVHKQLSGLYNGEEGNENDTSLAHLQMTAYLYIPLMLTTSLAFIFSYPGSYCSVGMLLWVFCIWTSPFFLGWLLNILLATHRHVNSQTLKVVLFIVRVGMFILSTILLYMIVTEEDTFITDVEFLITTVVCFVLTEYVGRLNVETPFRVKMLGKILGLKEFIETAEKPRLESLLQDDPQYFYRLLPYALVFGISDKWSEQFKDIEMERPDWYKGTSDLNSYMFANSITHSLTSSASNAITTVSHDSTSVSSSGGGGFSGGGGGGGGGGSW